MERPLQCPFIERVDHRCSSYFSLERLDHAFDVCFDRYKSCPLFHEMMAERRMKRTGGHHGPHDGASDNVPTRWVASNESGAAHAASRLVQVRVAGTTSGLAAIADAHAQHAAAAPRVSASPRL